MIAPSDDFQIDGYDMDFNVVNERDLTADPNFVAYNAANDINGDGDDDDTLFVFSVADGKVVIDISDRMYNKDDDTDYRTGIYLNTNTDGSMTRDADELWINEDQDTMLIVPEGGDTFTLDWGTDNRLDSVEVAHPQEKVDATYFIGTVEEQTTAESVITKADEGKEVTAGCCTFTVSKFDVNVGNTTDTGTATTASRQPSCRQHGSARSSSRHDQKPDTGWRTAVNAMTESIVTADEISATADKYVVKKSGNKE